MRVYERNSSGRLVSFDIDESETFIGETSIVTGMADAHIVVEAKALKVYYAPIPISNPSFIYHVACYTAR
ncbi:hypothetical protein FRX31_035426 [Thalictrum thalictroides]|uniref:Uncharacterized protein n=1 Tax=Thalictrum thalictroides TaxID=46969 RepID=A0A7J6UR31_THATH|nr:hypothetical protein FRX31_035426 [Thalictrum thalictroides]